MYYVIKRQHDKPLSSFLAFQVPKYIASKNNDNVIFEFEKDGKPIRKWVKKEDIILLTDDKEFFMQVHQRFQNLEEEQKQLVEQAKEQLNESIEHFGETMHAELDKFDEIKHQDDVPCLLKDL